MVLEGDAGAVEEGCCYFGQLGGPMLRPCQGKSAILGAEAGAISKIPAPPAVAGPWLGLHKCSEVLRGRDTI